MIASFRRSDRNRSRAVLWLFLALLPIAFLHRTAHALGDPDALYEPPGWQDAEVPRLAGPGVYVIGLVTLDQSNRTVRFPAAVNQRAGLVEYAVVTTTGKVHESIFRTEAKPRHLHLAMLLLGAQPAHTNLLSESPQSPLPGHLIGVDVAWKHGRKAVRRPLTDFVELPTPIGSDASRDWLYNGSFLVDGTFAAQRGGSIVALITDPAALVNNPRPDRTDDELHRVRTKALPPEDTPVEILFRLLHTRTSPTSRTGE